MINYKDKIPRIEDYWPLFLSTGWNASFKTDIETVEQALSNTTFAVSAYDGDKLVGFARALSDKFIYATIYDVIVLPEYKNRGIGSRLVSTITKQCKGAGVISVHLFAADGTETFYNQQGFKARPASMPGMSYEPDS